MLPAPLDYLFTAEFSDGTKLHQDRHDRSRVEPLTRSAFYDVLQRIAEVRRFSIESRDRRHLHVVDLTTGHFETDGQIICNPYGQLTNYRVIYFRRCEQGFEQGWVMRPKIVAYFIGWQANDAQGRNQQMTLEIPPLGLGGSRLKK
jgi:hypothetical protein